MLRLFCEPAFLKAENKLPLSSKFSFSLTLWSCILAGLCYQAAAPYLLLQSLFKNTPTRHDFLNNELAVSAAIMCNGIPAPPRRQAHNDDFAMQIPPAELFSKALFDPWDICLITLESKLIAHPLTESDR